MPWSIGTSDRCPAGKPHAVIKEADGAVEGCHATEEAAQRQMAALYASENKSTLFDFSEWMTKAGQVLMSGEMAGATQENQVVESLIGMVAVDVVDNGTGSRVPAFLTKSGPAARAFVRSFVDKLSQPIEISAVLGPHATALSGTVMEIGADNIVPPLQKQLAATSALDKELARSFSANLITAPAGGAFSGAKSPSTKSVFGAGKLLAAIVACSGDMRDTLGHDASSWYVQEYYTRKGTGLQDQMHFKRTWSVSFVNSLPDSAFLHVGSGGEKDDEGRTTPRSLRHLPFKNAQGAVDLPHLRNAISRLGQSETGTGADGWLTADLRKRLLSRARKILEDEQKDTLGDKMRDLFKALPDLRSFWSTDEKPSPPQSSFMHWKESDGTVRWIARYSNNIRDDDNPPEIISSGSHQRFVQMVDNKEVAAPELWLWHTPEWSLGKATWVAYDDSGFALAGGIVDEKGIPILEAIAALPPQAVRVSHGMPSASIQRASDDPTIITQHITREISPLPTRWAANKGTGFAILKENNVSIPTEKRQALIDQWGLTAEQLDALEAANAETAEQAKEAGLESKEVADETPETAEAKEQEVEQAETEKAATPDAPLTREEVADAFMAVVQPLAQQVAGLQEQLAEMTKEIGALKQTDEVKIAEKAADTPAASLLDLLQLRAVGAVETQVDGRTSLAKSKPAEAKKDESPVPGLPSFLGNIVAGDPSKFIQ